MIAIGTKVWVNGNPKIFEVMGITEDGRYILEATRWPLTLERKPFILEGTAELMEKTNENY